MLRKVPAAAQDLADVEAARDAYYAAFDKYRSLSNAAIRKHGAAFRHRLQEKHQTALDKGELYVHL